MMNISISHTMRFSCLCAFSLPYNNVLYSQFHCQSQIQSLRPSSLIYPPFDAFCGRESNVYQILNLFVCISQQNCSGIGCEGWRWCEKTLTSSGQWTVNWSNEGFLLSPLSRSRLQTVEPASVWIPDWWFNLCLKLFISSIMLSHFLGLSQSW